MSESGTELSPEVRAALDKLRKAQKTPPKQVTFDIEGASIDSVAGLVAALVHAADLSQEDRIEALGSAFAVEAVRGHSEDGDALKAHKKLSLDDDGLAKAIEALAPWLLGRISSREDGAAAIEAIEELLRSRLT